MGKTTYLGLLLVAGVSGKAHAANCSAYPYNLANGTTADATQVMSDFNNVLSCGNNILAPLASPAFTGNVGIGTAVSPTSLQIIRTTAGAETTPLSLRNNSSNANTAVSIDLDPTGNGIATRSAQIAAITNGTNQVSLVFRVSNADVPSEVMRIETHGMVGIGTASPSLKLFVNGTAGGTSAYQVTSDGRLKKNVRPITGGLATITRLEPVSFNWRAVDERTVGKSLALPLDERQIGFVAQDVEKVIPEAVTKPPEGSNATYQLKEDNLIPVLVAAIKEQQLEIDELREELSGKTSPGKR